MKTNEKAPDALAGDQSAIEINQVQDSTEPEGCQLSEIISELIEMTYRVKELNETTGVLAVGDNGYLKVQIDGEMFPGLFDLGGYVEDYAPGYDKYYTTVQGVEFFCLVEREAKKNA